MKRLLCHCSSHPFNAKEGDEIVLIPGKQNAQGKGVYLSEGEPDERASDSCYEAGGARTVFFLEAETNKQWWKSKGSTDVKKSRPRTWHTNGHDLVVTVHKVDGKNIYGSAKLAGL